MSDNHNPLFKSFLEQFETKHGNDAVWSKGVFYYSTGARRHDDGPYSPCYEPPENYHERFSLMIKYRELVLGRATTQFEELQESLNSQIQAARRWADSNAPPAPPSNSEINELENRKAKVVRARAGLSRVRREYEEAKANDPVLAARREQAAENRAAADRASDRLDKIKI